MLKRILSMRPARWALIFAADRQSAPFPLTQTKSRLIQNASRNFTQLLPSARAGRQGASPAHHHIKWRRGRLGWAEGETQQEPFRDARLWMLGFAALSPTYGPSRLQDM